MIFSSKVKSISVVAVGAHIDIQPHVVAYFRANEESWNRVKSQLVTAGAGNVELEDTCVRFQTKSLEAINAVVNAMQAAVDEERNRG